MVNLPEQQQRTPDAQKHIMLYGLTQSFVNGSEMVSWMAGFYLRLTGVHWQWSELSS